MTSAARWEGLEQAANGNGHAPQGTAEAFPSGARQPVSPGYHEKRNESGHPAFDAAGIRLFSVDELALSLGQSKRWVYRQVEERGMPALKLGRQLVFQLPAVMAWLEAQRIGDWTATGDGR